MNAKDLFVKYLQGNCTEGEFEQLLSWIKDSALTTSGKEMAQEVWGEFEPEAGPIEKMKYNLLLDKIHHKININQNPSQLTVKKGQKRSRILSVITRAAAVLLIPVLSLLIYTNLQNKSHYADNTNDLEVEAPAGSRMQFELGDGTKVWLNHGSKLRYPYRFTGKNREVHLTGEAYFVIAQNTGIPFIVKTGHLEVKATGTTFNVNAYPDDNAVETTLVEGNVVLYRSNSNQEIKSLSPSECLKFNSEKNTYILETGSIEKYTAWKDGLLVFKNDPVADIAKKLARWYNIEVEIIDERAKSYTMTATFDQETLPQVLELMALPTPVDYKLIPREKFPDGSFSKQKVLIGLKKG
jgi:ferric-dicitrate binding protein FerR (iron transport regulator)